MEEPWQKKKKHISCCVNSSLGRPPPSTHSTKGRCLLFLFSPRRPEENEFSESPFLARFSRSRAPPFVLFFKTSVGQFDFTSRPGRALDAQGKKSNAKKGCFAAFKAFSHLYEGGKGL